MADDKNHDYRRIVVDIDGTICQSKPKGMSYADCAPNSDVIEALRRYRQDGFYVILASSRQMRTHSNNVGKIIAETVPTLVEWLKKHNVPYDELHVGKPWCGFDGFYVDDRAIRPSEFVSMPYDEILKLISHRDDSRNG